MTIRTTIERLGHRGDGIAPGPVFVPMSLPGEEVEGVQEGDRLTEVRIITPSPDRVRPPCRHFKACGGCALQHGSDALVAEWKVQVVQDALAAHGLEAPVTLVATSPARSRRRATFSGRRTKKGALAGFHGRASGTIVEIPDCQLLHPELVAAIPMLEEITRLGVSRKGEVTLSVTQSPGGLDVAVSQAKPLTPELHQQMAALAREHGLARVSWDGELVVERHPPAQTFGKARVVPPPGAFLQATEEAQEALVVAVKKAVGPARSMLDLFAGCGTFSLPLAEQGRVHAVEGSGEMLAALEKGWRFAEGLKEVTTEARDLFRRPMLPDELAGYEAVIIDPPRAGAQAQAEELARSGVGVVAAVSCNPVTFARDARVLVQAGFGIDWIEVVDQFRWSAHVELVARFARRGE